MLVLEQRTNWEQAQYLFKGNAPLCPFEMQCSADPEYAPAFLKAVAQRVAPAIRAELAILGPQKRFGRRIADYVWRVVDDKIESPISKRESRKVGHYVRRDVPVVSDRDGALRQDAAINVNRIGPRFVLPEVTTPAGCVEYSHTL